MRKVDYVLLQHILQRIVQDATSMGGKNPGIKTQVDIRAQTAREIAQSFAARASVKKEEFLRGIE